MIFRVCGRHSNFYIVSLYRNPNNSDSICDCLLRSMALIQSSDRKAAFVFVGDLNAHHSQWLGSVSGTNGHGIAALDFCTTSGCSQLVDQPTHSGGNRLDLLMTDVPDLVEFQVLAPVGSSDHSAIGFAVKVAQFVPNVCIRREVFLKHRVNWNAVLDDLQGLCWGGIISGPSPIESLNEALLEIVKRGVPVRVLRFRSMDKPWFTDDCRRAFDAKQTAYRSWEISRTVESWDNIRHLRAEAELICGVAERNYDSNIVATLQNATRPHKWWSTLKRVWC